MAGLQPYRDAQQYKHVGRALSRLSARTDLQVASVNAATEVESARLDGLQLLAGQAMHGVAMVSQLESQLAQLVPLATSRLQAIGDVHALATAEVLSTASRRCHP